MDRIYGPYRQLGHGHDGPRQVDSVKAGEGLAVVDPADFQFAVEAAIAESALASAQNEKTRSGGYPQVHRSVLQPSTVVTDLWQTSQISGLRILALRIRRHTPRLLKAARASGWAHLKCSRSFGSSTATCFRGGSSNSSQFCDIGQSNIKEPRGRRHQI